MTTPLKSIFLGAALVAAVPVFANAEPPYQPYLYNQLTAAPPSWSYDPYTSGLGPCPQRRAADPPCHQTVDPTYGQPSYWPHPRW